MVAEHTGAHFDRLLRAAWALCGTREDAEDLVQETYARVLSRPRMVRNDDDLGYLMGALRNTFFSQRRKRRRQVVGWAVGPEADPIDPRGFRRPEREAETSAVYAAIARLAEDFRMALVAVDVVGLSYDEAARALKVPAGTVRSRVFRARDRIVEELRPAPKPEVAAIAEPRACLAS
jgi:RNA polymerase sigma-70 factor (ECF subfamily)